MTQAGGRHLALVAYCWGLDEQSRLIAGGLAPIVAELREQGLRHFWFDRFDARGPHVFALFTVPADQLDRTRERVAERLAAYLAEHPSRTDLPADELAARHQACRGTVRCAIDAEEGLAANNTFRLCEQPGDRYPFWLGRSLEDPEVLWDLLDELAAWSAERLASAPAGVPIGIATAWLAALFDALPLHFGDPRAYWRYYNASLVRRPAAEDGGEAEIHRLTQELGERNDGVLTSLRGRLRAEPPWPSLPRLLARLVEVAAGADKARGPGPKELLREIAHATLKQLGVPTRLERVLLLFFLRESLKDDAIPSA